MNGARGRWRGGDYFRLAATFGKGGDVTILHGDDAIGRRDTHRPTAKISQHTPAINFILVIVRRRTFLTSYLTLGIVSLCD